MKVTIKDTDSPDAPTEHIIEGNLADDAWALIKAADAELGVAGDMPYDELTITTDFRVLGVREIVVNWKSGRGSTGTYTFTEGGAK